MASVQYSLVIKPRN